MKKQSLLLLAGGMLALASCQNEAAAPAAGPSEAQIDSMVNARVEAIRTELMASNDSLINALAQWKADSMIAAMKGSKPAAQKPVAKKPTPPSGNSTAGNTGAVKSEKPTGIKANSDQNAQSGLNSIKSQSDQNSKGGLKSIKDNADKK